MKDFQRRDRRTRASRRTTRRIAVTSVAALVAAVLAVGATSAIGDESEAAPVAPFTHLDPSALGAGASSFKPASLTAAGTGNVIVKLSGASVGQQRAAAIRQGRDLSKGQQAALRNQLKDRQGGVAADIARLGGEVLEQYQDAYNGLAVSVPRDKIDTLRSLPGVVAVVPDEIVKLDNTAGVQYTGGNQAWADLGKTGAGVKIGIIDTGIDYFHANFGGAGRKDFHTNSTTAVEPGTFPTAKVVGGFDFVGDQFDSSSDILGHTKPHPDPDPVDCNGHGSHVAGSAAGFGVLAPDGKTFRGPYNATTYSTHTFRIGPGVAPNAKLYAYRIFGCEGSTSSAIIVAALNRALQDDVDVVNMSLGSPFSRKDGASAEASNTVAAAGVMVVASAGNSGSGGYITGGPSVADRALSVAALDASNATFPGADVALSTGATIPAQLSNGAFQQSAAGAEADPGFDPAKLPGLGALGVVVLKDDKGNISLGCDLADYSGVAVTGKLVVVLRGVCARVHKAIIGQQAGAAAVAMINTSAAFPPFEGDITVDPDTGQEFHVTIPFFGIRGNLGGNPNPAPPPDTVPSDGDILVAADGKTANSFTPAPVPNSGYQRAATFSSGGPRNVDSAVKPEVSAPGVSVKSTAVGTGTEATRLSGTSMAAPMTTGAAALVTEAHPDWSTEARKAALIDTAEAGPAKILAGTYNLRVAGSGVIQPRRATDTVAYVTTSGGRDTLDFGHEAISTSTFSKSLPLTLNNTSGSPITYNLSVATNGGQLGTVTTVTPTSVTVPAGGTASATATVSLDAAAIAALPDAATQIRGGISTVRGAVVATPTTTGAGLYSLRVPYLFVPRGLSKVEAGPKSAYTASGTARNATVPLTNSGVHRSTADVYAWGIHDEKESAFEGTPFASAEDSMNVRDVGVQVQDRAFLCGKTPAGPPKAGEATCGTADDRSLVFAIDNYGQASNPAVNEFDVVIDSNGDGRTDFFVVGVDLGAVTAGDSNGVFASFVFTAAGDLVNIWSSTSPMNGSTIELPTLASDIGLGPSSSKFTYHVNAFSFVPGGLVDTTESATFSSHQPAVSSGDHVALAPGASATLNVSADTAKFAATPQLGWLVVALDDANGAAQADEVPVGTLSP